MPNIDYSKFDRIVDSDDEPEEKAQRPQAPQTSASSGKPAEASKPKETGSPSASAKAKLASAPTQQPPKKAVRLAGVLSSHIGSQQRLERLEYLLRSVDGQSEPIDAFFMVWSAPDDMVEAVEACLLKFSSNNLEKGEPNGVRHKQRLAVKALRQTKRASQFYDIRWLYNEMIAKEPPGTWLLFTDDDDLWGPHRVKAYRLNATKFASAPDVTGLCATHKVRPTNRTKVASSAKQVNEHLASGDAKHCGGVHVEEEFFDFACPAKSLGVFLKMCNEETLLHPFCDLRFSRFLQEYYAGGKVMYFPTDTNETWVYYYSTAYRTPTDQGSYDQFVAQEQASTVVKLRSEDQVEAVALLKNSNGGREPKQEELDEMIDFVSTLRQNIEAMLIRHFPEEPLSVASLKRIAVGQAQGQVLALRLAEKLAREACTRFGLQLSQ